MGKGEIDVQRLRGTGAKKETLVRRSIPARAWGHVPQRAARDQNEGGCDRVTYPYPDATRRTLVGRRRSSGGGGGEYRCNAPAGSPLDTLTVQQAAQS